MNTPSLPPWRPRKASTALRERVFATDTRSDHPGLAGAVWPRFTLVVVSAWMCALAFALSPSVEGSRKPYPSIAGMSAVVAQNCLPVAGFTITNQSQPLTTNTAQKAL
jgi:hypothetical protein